MAYFGNLGDMTRGLVLQGLANGSINYLNQPNQFLNNAAASPAGDSFGRSINNQFIQGAASSPVGDSFGYQENTLQQFASNPAVSDPFGYNQSPINTAAQNPAISDNFGRTNIQALRPELQLQAIMRNSPFVSYYNYPQGTPSIPFGFGTEAQPTIPRTFSPFASAGSGGFFGTPLLRMLLENAFGSYF